MLNKRVKSALTQAVMGISVLLGTQFYAPPSYAQRGAGDFVPPITLEKELGRKFVLRMAGMPEGVGRAMMQIDAPDQAMNRHQEVSDLAGADVWIVGLQDWQQTDWLRDTPWSALFAERLNETPDSTVYRSFQWRVRTGQYVDVHFVNLSQTQGMPPLCLALAVYDLSREVMPELRVNGRAIRSARARSCAREGWRDMPFASN
ncbi:hypothetical protein JQX09_17490 [Sulfitobacter pseudonitzschiae]|nr:hypothetical protein [Pseudosulfitobacter pseudonitzschiae]MBM2292828.1 hypothetical protein [Pseudosulfitobacter pseudonitzschiae]MBM2298644.1 hypothetical protein [Pseudosulfitobacter pseudonitzschiae]MBM2303558.1 hypothetical protein [Pseudosulfitobacter pseudonitzschiae]MBM2313341.1 hypothetical protein [Pseudosulfitobacter pseudonitzschiae]MBM2318254.1 hypothetical protein [Pseudosulfitobacter pseudonitzschiae]